MKRTCLFLLLTLLAWCIKESCEVFVPSFSALSEKGSFLSDIAEEVTAIPLETPDGEEIRQVRQIRREGNELFFIGGETLYRFTRTGRFVGRITDPAEIRVAGYLVDPAEHRLIVLGNTDDIYYYSYEGILLEKKKLKNDLPARRMLSASLYKNRIWSIEESVTPPDTALQTACLTRQVVEYDTSFRPLASRPLLTADLGREPYIPPCFAPRLAVTDTGGLYAYEASPDARHLLRDTLFLKEKYTRHAQLVSDDDRIELYPVRFGPRFWMSCYTNPSCPSDNYTFCYDMHRNRHWEIKGGFEDNFYQTGNISDLEPIDLSGRFYCFSQSGEAVAETFPQNVAKDAPVVFIVKVKG